MVGAAEADNQHNRWSDPESQEGSNYGSRIDCYAWGEKIATIGGGHPRKRSRRDSPYQGGFNGTSGASAIIAGAAFAPPGIQRPLFQKIKPNKNSRVSLQPQRWNKTRQKDKGGNWEHAQSQACHYNLPENKSWKIRPRALVLFTFNLNAV